MGGGKHLACQALPVVLVSDIGAPVLSHEPVGESSLVGEKAGLDGGEPARGFQHSLGKPENFQDFVVVQVM